MLEPVKITLLSLPFLDPSPAFGFDTRTPLPSPIVACPLSAEVQRAIDACVTTGNAVLELGSQLSETSAHLCRAVGLDGRAVLADVKRKEATSGRSRGRDVAPFLGGGPPRTPSHANVARESFVDRVEYHELERYEEWRALVKGGRQFDVIILDVASTIGNDLHLSALSIANEFIASQRNLRSVVVKSKVLSKLSRRIIHSQRLLDGTVALPAKDELDGYPDPLIIPCVGVNDYRNTIPYVVDQGDEVIEVGCHYGTTTSLLYDASVTKEGLGFCAGVDIGEKIIQSARRRYPEINLRSWMLGTRSICSRSKGNIVDATRLLVMMLCTQTSVA
ncbi:hypothetical protein ACHAWF_006560 [Thalassiosira exigua]